MSRPLSISPGALAAALALCVLGCDDAPGSAARDAASAGAAISSATVAPSGDTAASSTAAGTAAAVDASSVCKQAASRYIGCMEEMLGEEAGALARSKQGEGVPACAKDPMTVAMYRRCLPKPDCEQFQACITEFAKKTDPRRPTMK